MFRNTRLFGISMATQHRRRQLVILVYVFVLAVTGWLSTLDPNAPHGQPLIWFYFGMMMVTWLIFGTMVKPDVMPPRSQPRPVVNEYHIDPDAPKSRPEEDERDVAVRHSAYASAYRILSVYSLSLLASTYVLLAQPLPYRRTILQFLALLLVALVVTLPQAIILWKEADLPDEEPA